MNKIKEFLKFELVGWQKLEVLWLVTAIAVITISSICMGDSVMGMISAVSGVMYVICAGKGKLSAYLFGFVNCVLYAIISYHAKLYGETMLNVVYYIPMQFLGFYTWSKHMNKETATVEKRKMNLKQRVFVLTAVILCTILYGCFLKYLKDAMPFLDAFTTVGSVFAMLISIKMFVEQWYIWFVVDVMSVVMWGITFANGNESIATLLMWVIYVFSAVIMCVKWEKEIRRDRI